MILRNCLWKSIVNRCYVLASALVLTLSFSCFASSQTLSREQSDSVQIDKVYRLSGLEEQFVHFATAFKEEGLRMGQGGASGTGISTGVLENLEQELAQKYDVTRLKVVVKQALKQELSQEGTVDRLPAMLEIINSRVWQKAVKLENRANDPARSQELEHYISVELQKQLPRQTRLNLIRELMVKTQAVSMTIDMMVRGAVSTAGVMSDGGSLPEGFESQLREEATAQRFSYQDIVTRHFLYTYRFMSDQQLATYVAYYDKPEIQALHNAMTMALLEAFR